MTVEGERSATIARLPAPPYWAVIFTSIRHAGDDGGYALMAREMADLAAAQPGYLGMEAAREAVGITVSYWRDEAAIKAWKRQIDHLGAQRLGRERYYRSYRVRVGRIDRDYGFGS